MPSVLPDGEPVPDDGSLPGDAVAEVGQRPLSLGADLVVASATKGLSGHSDLLAGYVAGCHRELMAAIDPDRQLAGKGVDGHRQRPECAVQHPRVGATRRVQPLAAWHRMRPDHPKR